MMVTYGLLRWATQDPLDMLDPKYPATLRRQIAARHTFVALAKLVARKFSDRSGRTSRPPAPAPAREADPPRSQRLLFLVTTDNQARSLRSVYDGLRDDSRWLDVRRERMGARGAARLAVNLFLLLLDPRALLFGLRFPKLLASALWFFHLTERAVTAPGVEMLLTSNVTSFEKLATLRARQRGVRVAFVPHGYLAPDRCFAYELVDLGFFGSELQLELIRHRLPAKLVAHVVGHLFVDYDPALSASKGTGVLICTNDCVDIEANRGLFRDLAAGPRPVRVRFHPAEDRARYMPLVRELGFSVSTGSMPDDLKYAEAVFSGYSGAAYVAFLADRPVKILEAWPEDSYNFRVLLQRNPAEPGFAKDRRPTSEKVADIVAILRAELRK